MVEGKSRRGCHRQPEDGQSDRNYNWVVSTQLMQCLNGWSEERWSGGSSDLCINYVAQHILKVKCLISQ